ncbi:MAG: hypothetical protein WCH62_05545 [Candidatus Omnitrophota bacterium]
MKQVKSEKIIAIKKRFKCEWLLIDIDVMDESTTTPISGRLIAHDPKRDKIYKLLLKSPQIKRPMIECTAPILPKGMAAAL